MKFYAYILCRPSGAPFYVGKGCGNRADAMGNVFSQRVAAKIKRNGGEVKVVKIYFPSEEEAFAKERYLISKFGRLDLGTGPLCNFTDGGEGLRCPFSEELLKKIRKPRSEQAKANIRANLNPVRGRDHPWFGKKNPRYSRALRSRNSTPVVCDDCGVTFGNVGALANHRAVKHLGKTLKNPACAGDNHWSHRHPERVRRGKAHWTRYHPDRIAGGERHGRAKLTLKQIKEIRRLIPKLSFNKIAKKFGVSRWHIKNIACGFRWKDR